MPPHVPLPNMRSDFMGRGSGPAFDLTALATPGLNPLADRMLQTLQQMTRQLPLRPSAMTAQRPALAALWLLDDGRKAAFSDQQGAIGMVDLGYVLAVGTWVFDVPLRGSLLLVFVAGALYMLTTLGVGLLVSAMARTQQQAFMGAMFFIMPAVLLSGFMTPVENMPSWLQPLSGLTPVRHFVEVVRAVLLKDAGWSELSAQLVALVGVGVAVFAASAYLLRRSLA